MWPAAELVLAHYSGIQCSPTKKRQTGSITSGGARPARRTQITQQKLPRCLRDGRINPHAISAQQIGVARDRADQRALLA
jgi:hypothetical protein